MLIFRCCCTDKSAPQLQPSNFFDDRSAERVQRRPAKTCIAKAGSSGKTARLLRLSTSLLKEQHTAPPAHPPPPLHIHSNGLPYRKPRHGYGSPRISTMRAQLPILTPSQAPSGPVLPSPSAPPRPPSPSLPLPRARRTPRSPRRSPRRPQSPSWTPSPVTASPPRSASSPPVLVFPSPLSATSSTSSTRSPLSSSPSSPSTSVSTTTLAPCTRSSPRTTPTRSRTS